MLHYIKKYLLYILLLLVVALDFFILDKFLVKKTASIIKNPFGTKVNVYPANVLATVYDKFVTMRELDQKVSAYFRSRGIPTSSLTEMERNQARQVLLAKLIDDKVLTHASKVNPVAFAPSLAKFMHRQNFHILPPIEQTSAILANANMNLTDLEQQNVTTCYQASWVLEKIKPALEVPETQAKIWYDKHKKFMELPTRIRASHIFLPRQYMGKELPENELQIAKIHQMLLDEEITFRTAVKKFSADAGTARRNGDLGYLRKIDCPDGFFENVAKLKTGEISKPFLTKLGWHIAKLTAHSQARKIKFDEIKEEISRHLKNKRLNYDDDISGQMNALKSLQISLKNKYTVLYREL